MSEERDAHAALERAAKLADLLQANGYASDHITASALVCVAAGICALGGTTRSQFLNACVAIFDSQERSHGRITGN